MIFIILEDHTKPHAATYLKQNEVYLTDHAVHFCLEQPISQMRRVLDPKVVISDEPGTLSMRVFKESFHMLPRGRFHFIENSFGDAICSIVGSPFFVQGQRIPTENLMHLSMPYRDLAMAKEIFRLYQSGLSLVAILGAGHYGVLYHLLHLARHDFQRMFQNLRVIDFDPRAENPPFYRESFPVPFTRLRVESDWAALSSIEELVGHAPPVPISIEAFAAFNRRYLQFQKDYAPLLDLFLKLRKQLEDHEEVEGGGRKSLLFAPLEAELFSSTFELAPGQSPIGAELCPPAPELKPRCAVSTFCLTFASILAVGVSVVWALQNKR